MPDKKLLDLIRYTDLGPFIMTVNCKLCGTELAEDHPAVIAQKIEDTVNWATFESDDKRYGKPAGTSFAVAGVGTVTVEDKKLKPTLDDIRDSSGYGYMEEGSYPQGTQFQVYVILRYGDTFFKKTGTADSYGEIAWDSILVPTKPKQVTVTAWE
jgi:hypothetical protein